MPDQVVVRPAAAGDVRELARLRYEFRAPRSSPLESEAAFISRCAAWMRPRLDSGDAWRAWVAETSAGAIVGTAWVGLIEKLPNPGAEPEEHAYLTNVYVRADARGSGIGSALLDVAVAWCGERGVHAAILWPTARSMPLYRRHGFASPAALLERAFSAGPDRGAPGLPA